MCKLKYVALHITRNCSHDCPYCYYRGRPSPLFSGDDDLDFPFDTLVRIIDECGINEVSELYLLGGDPAEHPRILDLAKHAHALGIIVTSVSNTHDYKCDSDQLPKYVSICESTIHGIDAKSHDEFCGVRGAYHKALSRLKMFHDLGCTTGITVNVMPANVKMLYSMVKNILDEYGTILQYVNVQRIAPHGRAGVEDGYYLMREHLIVALSQIDRIASELGMDIQCEDAFPLCLIPQKYWRFIHRCEWGYEKLSINGDGNVSRCGADPRYNLGNVLNTPLREIWNESPLLKEFRKKEFLIGKCQRCPNLKACGGGCMLGTWSGREFGTDYLLSEFRGREEDQ